jgi:hypothetical protein
MRHFHPGKFALGALLLAACSAPALYRPYADSGSYGYSEVNIAKNRYEVFFHGPADLDDAAAKNFAIARAAEIGKRNGFLYFRVANSRVRRETTREYLEPELFPQNRWTGESLTREERERRAWEDSRRRRQRVVALKPEPVAQLNVYFRNDDCEDCLSVEEKLREAVEQGILKP